MLEGKPWRSDLEGVVLPWGQWKMLKAFATKPGITVLVIGEDKATGVYRWANVARVTKPDYLKHPIPSALVKADEFRTGTRDELSNLVRQWWAAAEKKKG